MVTAIVVIAIDNALARPRAEREAGEGRVLAATNWYALISVLMIASAIVFGIAGWKGFDYWLLWLEGCLIALFAAYWMAQTFELWFKGVARVLPAGPKQGGVGPGGAGLTASGMRTAEQQG